MDENVPSEEASSNGFDRRGFIKKAAITGAVAVPVVSSFSMTGVNAAFAQQTNVSGRQNTTTTQGGTSPTSGEATTTTEAPSTTTTTTAPNQTPSTTTTTTAPNQAP